MARMRGTRADRIKTLAADLTAETGAAITADYDGRQWELRWDNGPRAGIVRELATVALDNYGLTAGDITGYYRIVQDDAYAVLAIRLARAGNLPAVHDPRRIAADIEFTAEELDYPERPIDQQEADLAARLRAVVATGAGITGYSRAIAAHGGIGWLVAEAAGIATTGDADPQVSTTGGRAGSGADLAQALTVLTIAYATGADHIAWQQTGALLSPLAALAAVRGDQSPGVEEAAAGLVVVRAIAASLEHDELMLLTAARAAGATWERLGQALGIRRSGAQKRHADLTARARP